MDTQNLDLHSEQFPYFYMEMVPANRYSNMINYTFIHLRVTHDNAIEKLSGVVPVVEDWHARLTFMKVKISYQHY